MNDKISIIIPIYNGEKYIEKCLNSVLNQTYKNIEILLINDGSKDNTLQAIKKYQEQDDRIIVIDKDNTGVSDSRNCGIDKSSGNYIMFVDSDDWIEYDMVENMYYTAIKESADWIKCGYYIENSKGENKEHPALFEQKSVIDDATQLIHISINSYYISQIWAQLIKKSVLIENNIRFNRELTYAEDYDFNINLIKNTNKFLYLPQRYYHYFHNDNGSIRGIINSEKMINEMKSCIKVYKKLKDFNIGREYNKIINKRIKEEVLIIIKRSYNQKNKIKFNEKINLLKKTRAILIDENIEKQRMGILRLIYNKRYFIFTTIYYNYYNLRQLAKKIIKRNK